MINQIAIPLVKGLICVICKRSSKIMFWYVKDQFAINVKGNEINVNLFSYHNDNRWSRF